MLGAKLPEALVSGDLNTLRNGTYQTSASLTNKPEGSGSSAIIWHTTYAEGFWGIQFYLDRNAQLIYFRHFVSSGYQPWQILYGNSILTNSTLLSQLASALGVAGYTAITVGSTPVVIKSGNTSQLACVVDVTFFSSCYGKFSSNGTLVRNLYKDTDFSTYIDVSISNGNLIISNVSASVSTINVYYKITKFS